MLSHNDVHYLVGMLNRSDRTEDVDITLGQMVYDIGAEKKRDVDITIKTRLAEVPSLAGIEVKDERAPLDVTVVEQLIKKLSDMPELSSRAIVSTSGYTQAAISKAKFNETKLLVLENYVQGSFPHVEFSPDIQCEVRVGESTLTMVPIVFKQLREIDVTKPIVGIGLAETFGNLHGITFSNSHRTIKLINIPLSERTKTILRDIKI